RRPRHLCPFPFLPRPPPCPTPFPYTTLFRSQVEQIAMRETPMIHEVHGVLLKSMPDPAGSPVGIAHGDFKPNNLIFSDSGAVNRSEEHTSELQSRFDLVCRLLLEKNKTKSRD